MRVVSCFRTRTQNHRFTETKLQPDECEGCQTHNLLCEKGTGRLHGFTTDGHFAEYSLSDYRNAMVLPDGMDMVSAAPLFCAGITGMKDQTSAFLELTCTTAYHAINECELKEGQWLVVAGCDGLGHLGKKWAHMFLNSMTNEPHPSHTVCKGHGISSHRN